MPPRSKSADKDNQTSTVDAADVLPAEQPDEKPVEVAPADKSVDGENPAAPADQANPAVEPTQDEPVDNPESDASVNDENSAAPVVKTTDHGTYTYKQGQGNTNPADLDTFDAKGNFIEKRDR